MKWSVFDQTVGGGSSITPINPAHVSVQLYIGGWIDIETCGMDDLFPPDDLMFGSDTSRNCAFIYDLYFDT